MKTAGVDEIKHKILSSGNICVCFGYVVSELEDCLKRKSKKIKTRKNSRGQHCPFQVQFLVNAASFTPAFLNENNNITFQK